MALKSIMQFVLFEVTKDGLKRHSNKTFNSTGEAIGSIKKPGTYIPLYVHVVEEDKTETTQSQIPGVDPAEELTPEQKVRIATFADAYLKGAARFEDLPPELVGNVAIRIGSDKDLFTAYNLIRESLGGELPKGETKEFHDLIIQTAANGQY